MTAILQLLRQGTAERPSLIMARIRLRTSTGLVHAQQFLFCTAPAEQVTLISS